MAVKSTKTPAASRPAANPASKPAVQVAAPAVETVKQATRTVSETAAAVNQKEASVNDTIKNAAQTATNKAETVMADMNTRAKAAFEKGSKAFEDMNDFSKGNVEALVESSKIAAKGFEKIGQDAAEYGRTSFEKATAAFRQMASVKSPAELFRLQSEYVRDSFDTMVAETSKNSEAMLKLAGEIAQPISNRVAVAADKMKVVA